MDNPYLALTDEFNAGSLRTLLSSGQAVVVHRLAVMSKDGDWIVRESPPAIEHVLRVLEGHGARYRFGAPLDVRWLAGGWSSHFEFRQHGLRIRTDFVTRPPRISQAELAAIWRDSERNQEQVIGLVPLAALKLTNREKDYAVVGELARAMKHPTDQLRYSRSASDLMALAKLHPDSVAQVIGCRPVLAAIPGGREVLEEALDRERRALMRENEQRLAHYQAAARQWAAAWPSLAARLEHLPLRKAHEVLTHQALGVLPFEPDRDLP